MGVSFLSVGIAYNEPPLSTDSLLRATTSLEEQWTLFWSRIMCVLAENITIHSPFFLRLAWLWGDEIWMSKYAPIVACTNAPPIIWNHGWSNRESRKESIYPSQYSVFPSSEDGHPRTESSLALLSNCKITPVFDYLYPTTEQWVLQNIMSRAVKKHNRQQIDNKSSHANPCSWSQHNTYINRSSAVSERSSTDHGVPALEASLS